MSCELVQVGIYERREGRDVVVSKVESCGHRSVVHKFSCKKDVMASRLHRRSDDCGSS